MNNENVVHATDHQASHSMLFGQHGQSGHGQRYVQVANGLLVPNKLDVVNDAQNVEQCCAQIGPANDAGDRLDVDGVTGEQHGTHDGYASATLEPFRQQKHKQQRYANMQHQVGQVETIRAQSVRQAVETERNGGYRSVTAVAVGRENGSSPVVVGE